MKHVPIVMPQMGESVAEGTIVSWHHDIGDEIHADEIIVEVETDKTNVEVESPASGRLASQLKQVGERAAAGEVIGMIETADETSEAPTVKPSVSREDSGKPVEPTRTNAAEAVELPAMDENFFSPFVLRMALTNNVTLDELRAIRGTGKNGRVTKRDLLAYLAQRPVAAATVESITGKQRPGERELASLGKVVPMSSIRRTIADHMVQSIRTSAHVTMVHPVDMTHIVDLRTRIKERFEKQYHARLSYTAVMLFVTARVLKDFPAINATVYGTNIIMRNEINIGCAVALADESLVVPVVHHADQKSFPEIARELAELIRLARRKTLKRKHVEGGTFTISNFGAFGSLLGTPIISQPQVAILGMGAVFKAPVIVNNDISIRDQLYLSFSFDHRVIDGAMGGRFLREIQEAVESLDESILAVDHMSSDPGGH